MRAFLVVLLAVLVTGNPVLQPNTPLLNKNGKVYQGANPTRPIPQAVEKEQAEVHNNPARIGNQNLIHNEIVATGAKQAPEPVSPVAAVLSQPIKGKNQITLANSNVIKNKETTHKYIPQAQPTRMSGAELEQLAKENEESVPMNAKAQELAQKNSAAASGAEGSGSSGTNKAAAGGAGAAATSEPSVDKRQQERLKALSDATNAALSGSGSGAADGSSSSDSSSSSGSDTDSSSSASAGASSGEAGAIAAVNGASATQTQAGSSTGGSGAATQQAAGGSQQQQGAAAAGGGGGAGAASQQKQAAAGSQQQAGAGSGSGASGAGAAKSGSGAAASGAAKSGSGGAGAAGAAK